MMVAALEGLLIVAVVGLGGFVLLNVFRTWASVLPAMRSVTSGPAEREALALVDHLREIAWDHRDINPELSTVILDEIRRWERQRPKG